MQFIKCLALLVLLAIFVAGCSQIPGRKTAKSPKIGDEGFEPLPDPYLSQTDPLPTEVRQTFKQARQAMEAQEWQIAQAKLEQLIETDASLSGPYVNLGLIHWQQGEEDKAAEAFARAIEVNLLNSEAYNQFAILRREQGKFEEAEQLYLQALEIWPHNPVTHRNLGILYDLYMGRLADALRHYKLSQQLAEEPERQVEGWIVDLQRRITEQQAAVR